MNTWREWITSNPSVMMGKPVIVGTRITVELRAYPKNRILSSAQRVSKGRFFDTLCYSDRLLLPQERCVSDARQV